MKKTDAERAIAELNRRMIQSRRALAGWQRSGTEMALAQINAEIGALQGLLLKAPPHKHAVISALISKYGGKPIAPTRTETVTDEIAEILGVDTIALGDYGPFVELYRHGDIPDLD